MILLSVVVVAALIFFGVVLSAQAEAVTRLVGHNMVRVLVRQLRVAHGATAWRPIALIVLAGCVLGVATEPQRVAALAPTFAAVLTAYLVLALAVHGLTIAALRCGNLVAALKGRLPATPLIAMDVLLRAGCAIAVGSFMITGVNALHEYQRQDAEGAAWSGHEDIVTIALSAARDLEPGNPTTQLLAARTQELGAQGRALLFDYADSALDPATQGQERMTYSRSAARQLLDPAVAAQVDSADPTRPLLIIPPGGPSARALEDPAAAAAFSPVCAARACTVVAGPQHYQALTLRANPEMDYVDPLVIAEPLVVVVPDDAWGLSDRNVVALITQGAVGFVGAEPVGYLRQDPELSSFIAEARPAADRWAASHRRIATQTMVCAVGAGLAGLMALIYGAVSGMMQALLRAQRLRAVHVVGRNPLAVYVRCLPADVVVLGCLAAYFWHKGLLGATSNSQNFVGVLPKASWMPSRCPRRQWLPPVPLSWPPSARPPPSWRATHCERTTDDYRDQPGQILWRRHRVEWRQRRVSTRPVDRSRRAVWVRQVHTPQLPRRHRCPRLRPGQR